MKSLRLLPFAIFLFLIGCKKSAPEIPEGFAFQNGDIIFQTSTSSQSAAIQLATGSKYSHCGIVFDEGRLMVFEAIQPVKMTPLNDWIARGKDSKYVVKRLADNKDLKDPMKYEDFCKAANSFSKKSYDLAFDWSDDKIYCSELIWKTYQRGLGIELSKPEKLKDFNLTDKSVKAKLKQRYGKSIPYGQTVVSPKALFESELLKTVYSN